MNLEESDIYYGLGGVLLGECPCVDYKSNIFGVKAGFSMDSSHVFPQSVLAIVPLIAIVIGVGVFRACT